MPHSDRTGVDIIHMDCVSVDGRQFTTKDKVYVLSIKWSDGSETLSEVLQSTLSDFRTRLKHECYANRPDVDLPDIPSTGLIELLNNAGKRKKAMQEFCQQVLQLPDAPEKTRIVNEFFSSSNQHHQHHRRQQHLPAPKDNSTSVFYADIVTALPPPSSTSGYHSTDSQSHFSDDAVQYAELTLPETMSSALSPGPDVPDGYAEIMRQCPQPAPRHINEAVQYAELEVPSHSTTNITSKKQAVGPTRPPIVPPDTEPLYCEVTPKASQVARLIQESAAEAGDDSNSKALDEPDGATDEVDGAGDIDETATGPLYINVAETPDRPYENMHVGKKAASVDKLRYCKVVQNYIPNTCHSQGLAVEEGDVVQLQIESGQRAYCLLCYKFPATNIRPMEGWLPMDILKPCQPVLVENTDSQVPVYTCNDVEESSHFTSSTSSTSSTSTVTDNKVDRTVKKALRSLPLKLNEKPPEKPKNNHISCDVTFDVCTMAPNFSQSGLVSPIPIIPDIMSPSVKLPSGKDYLELVASQAMKSFKNKSSSASGSTDSDPSKLFLRVVAVADYKTPATGTASPSMGETRVISFSQGDLADLLYCCENNWWCVLIDGVHGWVPADFWRILSDDGRIGSGDTAPWMVGRLSRDECEKRLLKHGNQRDFVVRQSKNPDLAGQYALSIKYNNRIHHFPIVPTEDGKFYIGKHHFSTLENVIIYYMKNTLFRDESGMSVTLGSPFQAPLQAL